VREPLHWVWGWLVGAFDPATKIALDGIHEQQLAEKDRKLRVDSD
jgi:hypothetical protein